MKRTTRIFKHFIAILNILACGVPLIVLGIITIQDVLPKYFTSLGMQHHGNGSSTFSDDIDDLGTYNEFQDVNYNMMSTLDRMGYLTYSGTFDDYLTTIDGNTYTTIVSNCDTHFLLNYDYVSIFMLSDITNNNNSVALYLFVNFYINYFINVSILYFLTY